MCMLYTYVFIYQIFKYKYTYTEKKEIKLCCNFKYNSIFCSTFYYTLIFMLDRIKFIFPIIKLNESFYILFDFRKTNLKITKFY